MALSRRSRRLLLFVHVLVAVGWLGVDLAIGVLTFTGFTTGDPKTMATAYAALAIFAVPLLATLGLATLATGVALGKGTGVGLVRYWWVAAKLLIGLVLTGLVPVALHPTVAEAAMQSQLVDSTLPLRLADTRLDLIFPPVVSTTALVVAAWLGWYKPGGRTPIGERRARQKLSEPQSSV